MQQFSNPLKYVNEFFVYTTGLDIFFYKLVFCQDSITPHLVDNKLLYLD